METQLDGGEWGMCFVIGGCGLLLALFVGIAFEDISVRSWQDARRRASIDACRGLLGAAPPERTGASIDRRLWDLEHPHGPCDRDCCIRRTGRMARSVGGS
jgi:hypothetical protein